VLADLEQWARLAGWSRHHVRSVERFWRVLGEPRPFRVIDVACGLGGLIEDLIAWADKNDVDLVIAGVDSHEQAIEQARDRLGERALLACGDPVHLGCEPQVWHLATCTLLLNQLSGPDRLRLVAELTRAAQTAYLFDVTPTVTGGVGARLIPRITGLGEAPPDRWVRTLERAPTFDELVRLVAPLPVEVVRVFPSALCTQPEDRQRVKLPRPDAESTRVSFAKPALPPGTVGSDRSGGDS
jgi:SAM-dependent methyltransferase